MWWRSGREWDRGESADTAQRNKPVGSSDPREGNDCHPRADRPARVSEVNVSEALPTQKSRLGSRGPKGWLCGENVGQTPGARAVAVMGTARSCQWGRGPHGLRKRTAALLMRSHISSHLEESRLWVFCLYKGERRNMSRESLRTVSCGPQSQPLFSASLSKFLVFNRGQGRVIPVHLSWTTCLAKSGARKRCCRNCHPGAGGRAPGPEALPRSQVPFSRQPSSRQHIPSRPTGWIYLSAGGNNQACFLDILCFLLTWEFIS